MREETKLAVKNYSFVLFLMASCLLMSWTNKDPANVMFFKLLLVPLLFLSFIGLSSIFKAPIVESKVTLRAIEYQILYSFLMTMLVVLFLWSADWSLAELGKNFGLTMVVMSVFNLGNLALGIHNLRKQAQS